LDDLIKHLNCIGYVPLNGSITKSDESERGRKEKEAVGEYILRHSSQNMLIGNE
jgi:hypothetical protein